MQIYTVLFYRGMVRRSIDFLGFQKIIYIFRIVFTASG